MLNRLLYRNPNPGRAEVKPGVASTKYFVKTRTQHFRQFLLTDF